MRPVLSVIVGLLIWICLPQDTYATHMMGADMSYTWISGNTYQVRLSFYRDCSGSNAPQNATITYRSASCNYSNQINAPRVADQEVSAVCAAQINQTSCNNGSLPGVYRFFYTTQITLPYQCTDWTFAWRSCCRNNSITTTAPTGQGDSIYVEAKLNNLVVPNNNSATFSSLPVPYFCANLSATYNHGAVDVDGDSLVYTLIDPRQSPSTSASFIPPFSGTYPINTIPANAFNFNGYTGQMSFTPNGIQQGIAAVRVDEYRNGVWIGSVVRDIQLVIISCNNNQPTQVQTAANGNMLNLSGGAVIGNNTLKVCVGSTVTFQVSASDPNGNQTIAMATNLASAIPGATFTTSGNNPKTGTFSWTPTASDVGYKAFALTISDQACPIPSTQVIGFAFSVVNASLAAPDFTLCPGVTSVIQLNATVTGGVGCPAGNCYTWTPSTGLSATNISNPVATVSSPINYTVKYSDGVCVRTEIVSISPVGSVQIQPQDTFICIGTSFNLNAVNTFQNVQSLPCEANPGAPCGGSLNILSVGNGTSTTNVSGSNLGAGTPFQGAYTDGRVQYLFRKNELTAAGLVAGLIRSIAFNITDQLSTIPYSSLQVKLACTSLTTIGTTFTTTGFSPVYLGNFIPIGGWNTLNFSSPFQWDGNSNILVEICYNNANATNFDHVACGTTSFQSTLFKGDNGGTAGCSLTGPSPVQTNIRPNVRFANCIMPSPLTYTWTKLYGNTVTSSLSASNIQNPVAFPNDTTAYVVAVSNGLCTLKDTVVISTYPVSTLAPMSPIKTCPGDTLYLSATGTYINSYSWSFGATGPTATFVVPLTNQNYWVKGYGTCDTLTRNFNIAPTDTIFPVIYNCPPSVTLYSTPTNCKVPYSWTVPTYSDNCPNPTFIQLNGLPNGSQFPVGVNTVTYRARDMKGNITLCSFTVTVLDTLKPLISNCPSNITLNAAPNLCSAVATWALPSFTDNCVGASMQLTSGLPSGSAFPVGTTLVKYVVTDVSGNKDSCSFTVTVLDTQFPTIQNLPANITVSNSPTLCGAIVSWTLPTVSDNCPNDTIYQSSGIANGGFFPTGTSTVVYTATDGVGNTVTGSFTVTVNDTEAPIFAGCLGDTTISTNPGQCVATFTWSTPTVTDNCPGAITFTQTSGPVSGSTFPIGTTAITYTAADVLGNTSVCSFNLTVTDMEFPVISGCPGNITVPKDTTLCGAAVSWTEPTATDNCGLTNFSQIAGPPSGSFFPLGPTQIVYTATDAAGNADTCQFVIFVTDAAFPVITGCPSNIVMNNDVGVCGATVSWVTPVATDNCPGVTLNLTQGLANGAVFPIGTTTVEYTATDAALNSVTCSFTVTVNDTENPLIQNCPANIIQGNDPAQCGAVVTWTPPSVTDNCPGVNMLANYTPGTLFPVGNYTVNYIATDSSGNQDTCSFTITVNDAEGPTFVNCPGNVTQSSTATSCDALVNWIPPTVIENCSGSMTVVSNYNPGDLFPSGLTVVTYTATDSVGNSSSCSFTVTINDSIAPVISNCPTSIILNANANCQAIANWIPPTATDNCPVLQFVSNYVPNDTFPLGITTVYYVATDGAGNTDSCSFTVTVLDVSPPVITNCPVNITYQLTTRCDTTIAWTPPTASDNCSVVLSSNHQPNDVFPIGTTQVKYLATDGAGNLDSCKFTVTVVAPTPLSSSMTKLSDVHCLNGNDGKAVVELSGGSGSYNYSWTTFPSQSTDTAFNLNVGTWYVYISDSLAPACVSPIVDSVVILQLAPVALSLSGTNPTCYGLSDGSIQAVASAGTSPYAFSWVSGQNTANLSNLPVGTYTVFVTDAFNCVDTASYTLTQPDSLSGIANQLNIDCWNNKTGLATIAMSGGTTPYSYQWSFQTVNNDTLKNLPAGSYTVTVTDANQCKYTHTFNLTQPTELLISTTQTEVICRNSATGTATVDIQGGTTPYTVSWNTNPPQSTLAAVNMLPGTYTVFVTDDNGCQKKATVKLTNPPLLRLALTDTLHPYCDLPNGAIWVKATGGIPGYTYTWNTQTPVYDSALLEILGGTYECVVADTRGCTDTLQVKITNTPPATPNFTSIPDNSKPILLSQAKIQFKNLSEGAVAYTWNFGDTNGSGDKNPTHTYYTEGFYTVTLTAYNEFFICPRDFSLTYEIIWDGSIYIPNVFTPNGDGQNDMFGVFGDGIASLNYTVYDRWGKVVFQSQQIGEAWDGTLNGKPLPEGSYVWEVKAVLNDGKALNKGGTVMIMR